MTTDIKLDRDSRFLYAEDLTSGGSWREFTLTIADVIPRGTLETGDNKKVDRHSLAFEETDKMLVMNGTNLRLLRTEFGSNKAADWIGKKVRLYPTLLDQAFGQANVPCIRVRITKPVPYGCRKHMGKDLTK